MKRTHLLLSLLLPGWFLMGCGGSLTYAKLAEQEMESFHQRFNQKKFSEIYAASAENFRKTGSEQSFTAFLTGVRTKLGPAVSIASPSSSMRNVDGQVQIILVEQTQFEKGSGTETFTYAIMKGKAVMMGYFLKSAEMSAP